MGYYASTAESLIRITDEKGLLTFLRENFEMSGSWRNEEDELFDRLSNAAFAEIYNYDRGNRTFSLSVNEKYREEYWDIFAPYFKGFIQWQGEDGCVWRDVFDGEYMVNYYPEVIWSDEAKNETVYALARG